MLFAVGDWAAASQVIEIWSATSVEAVTQVLEEGASGWTKIFLELINVLHTVLDFLAHYLGKICCNLMHALRLWSANVVELVSVPVRPLDQANRCGFTLVARADEAVLAIATH